MNKITQTMLFRQSLIRYAIKNGVTKAAIKYKTNRQYIYRWLKRYDGTLQSLADHSHRPHNHPMQHTGKKFYQYTAIDEFSRFRYLEAFEESSTYSSMLFLEHMLKAFKFNVECVQTDNGFEFTKRFGGDKNDPTLAPIRLEIS